MGLFGGTLLEVPSEPLWTPPGGLQDPFWDDFGLPWDDFLLDFWFPWAKELSAI